jgi:hypothetical protein
MICETRIFSHKDNKLKKSYREIYEILRSIRSCGITRSDLDKLRSDHYEKQIDPQHPRWLKIQMIKLIRKKISWIKGKRPRKWFEFRLIVPKSKSEYVGEFFVPSNLFIKSIMFDSKSVFLTLGRKSGNGKPKHINQRIWAESNEAQAECNEAKDQVQVNF